MSRVVVVTDSTASLPTEVAEARGVRVVPLQVVIGAAVLEEGPGGATPDVVAEALRDFVPVSTSRPAPALFAELYRSLAAEGADEIVSVHLSGEMSGTFESAQLGALEVDLPVQTLNTRASTAEVAIAASRWRTTSATKMKSRVCSPSPWMPISRPSRSRSAKIEITPE